MAYIKDSAIACLEKMFCELRENSDKISRIKAVFLKNYVIPTLEASKTADVEEVKHGEWIKNVVEKHGIHRPTFICSKCGKRRIVLADYDYCPYCGAKMERRDT